MLQWRYGELPSDLKIMVQVSSLSSRLLSHRSVFCSSDFLNVIHLVFSSFPHLPLINPKADECLCFVYIDASLGTADVSKSLSGIASGVVND